MWYNIHVFNIFEIIIKKGANTNMMDEKQEVLNFLNALRDDGKTITLENAKRAYICKERSILRRCFPEQLINEVFGEPNHLEKAEIMLLKIEEMEQDKQVDEHLKQEYIIETAYEISNACGKELDSNNQIWEKYATLYAEIPIEIIRFDKMPLWYPGLEKETVYVTADELKVACNWFKLPEANREVNLAKREHLNYVFQLVYISLKKIFGEVKSEIVK